jgi:hypothetical protein
VLTTLKESKIVGEVFEDPLELKELIELAVFAHHDELIENETCDCE